MATVPFNRIDAALTLQTSTGCPSGVRMLLIVAKMSGPGVVAHCGNHPEGLKLTSAVSLWTGVPCMVTLPGGEVSAPIHTSKQGCCAHAPVTGLKSRSLMSFAYVASSRQPSGAGHAPALKIVGSYISDKSQVTLNMAPAGMSTRSFGIPYIFSRIVGGRMPLNSTPGIVTVNVVFTQSGLNVRMSFPLVFVNVAVLQIGAPGREGAVSVSTVSLYFAPHTFAWFPAPSRGLLSSGQMSQTSPTPSPSRSA